ACAQHLSIKVVVRLKGEEETTQQLEVRLDLVPIMAPHVEEHSVGLEADHEIADPRHVPHKQELDIDKDRALALERGERLATRPRNARIRVSDLGVEHADAQPLHAAAERADQLPTLDNEDRIHEPVSKVGRDDGLEKSGEI